MSELTVHKFLKDNNMLFDSYNQEEMERVFLVDMEEKKSLLMSNSYQNPIKNGSPDGDILVIDMGGTNYRLAVYNNGVITKEVRKPMYGIEKELDGEEFFDLIAADIEQYPVKKVGFCFSYEIITMPNMDVEIVHLAKEIKLRNIKGKILGEELNKRLSLKREFYIINDTVAAQLGVGADVGIIIGTGFNIAFTDSNLNSIIDSECGQYVFFPKGKFDNCINSKYPDSLPCVEKQVSGAYLAPLIKSIADAYFNRPLPDFDLIEVTKVFDGEGLLYKELSFEELDDFKCIVKSVIDRASRFIAVLLKCLLSKNNQNHIKIALEGSTVYKLPGYYESLEKAFVEILNRDFEIVDARGCIFIGCAQSTI